MKIKVIEQKDRVFWDLYIFVIIAIAAFEIPYELLVDIEDKSIKAFFDYLFFISFGIDILLNCITVQNVRGSGWLGVRKMTPKNYFIPPSHEESTIMAESTVNTFPKTMHAYLTSWWFIVDFLAIFPFEIVFNAYSGLNMSRTLRLARLPRIMRAIRAVKAIKAFNSVDNAFHLNPSLGRFILLCVTVPWLMHLFACLISYYEASPEGMQLTYKQALEQIFITFTTNNMASVSTHGGKITAIISVLTGYLFFGLLMGNFATFFSQIDSRKAMLESKINQWKHFFKIYPRVFTRSVQKRILVSEKDNIHSEANIKLAVLIESLHDEKLKDELIKTTTQKHINESDK